MTSNNLQVFKAIVDCINTQGKAYSRGLYAVSVYIVWHATLYLLQYAII